MKTACRFFALFIPLAFLSPATAQPLRTVAESSEYKATSRHDDVTAFCARLAKESSLVRLSDIGTSGEGRKIPLVIVADPPVSTPEEAAKSGKLVVFAQANIHAGEVDGKEALLMLARDLALAKERPLLKDLVLVFAPNVNPDGGEKVGAHRPRQNGPAEVGTRANAGGLDLNRDFVKLEAPEGRAMVRAYQRWQPALVIDCHTTNGSYHRYTITYDSNRCPAGDPRLIAFARDELTPDAGRRLEKSTGMNSFYYGDFSKDHKLWQTVNPTPRYGSHHVGLRGRLGVLVESYSYAPFAERVRGSYGYVLGLCESLAASKDKVKKLLDEAGTVKAGDALALRAKVAPLGGPRKLLGYVEEERDGKVVNTGRPQNYEAVYQGGTETTLEVKLPHAYLVLPGFPRVAETLQRHGVALEELREEVELDVEASRVEAVARAANPYQKHTLVSLAAPARAGAKMVPAGTLVVKTGQKLGRLAGYLLEAQAADGLAAWNFFDEALKEGADFPVLRLPAAAPLLTTRARPLAEDRKQGQTITWEKLQRGESPNFSGSPLPQPTWLDDGEHFLLARDNRLQKVSAATGRMTPYFDPDKLAAALAALPTIGKDTARGLAASPFPTLNPQKTAALFFHEGDLYHAQLDGGKAVRLTRTPGKKELTSFSPDGQFVAFTRDGNLFVVDVATQTERALTTDGGGLISNGKADWVYFEEVFYRSERAYWWSPDSKRIAFLRFDDTPVPRFTVLDPVPVRQGVEVTPYPKAGQPNPHVKLGVVTAAGGEPRWAELGDYSETSSLLVRAGWLPDSQNVYLYVQDRAQTWLDVCTLPAAGGPVKRLLRETTKAWVDDPGPLTFLKDGSFLMASARTGYNHLYRFDKDGKLLNAVTSGPWEVTTGPFQPEPIEHLDEAGGWVYFTGKKDSPIAGNLYRVKLDGTGQERLTPEAGSHRVRVSPKGNLFVDGWSSLAGPSRVRLARADGATARTLDSNPVYALEEYRRGPFERVQIPTPDGFVLEGTLLKPPDFDAKKKYPVWVKVYGGPHMPTVSDSWGGGRVPDEALASMGFLVFHVDPRCGSGKGHVSTWTCYRQLGVQELKDLETAVTWLTKNPWADAARVGMSGASYGGFFTAYAMTHSKLFAAGIAALAVTDWRNYDSIYTERFMNTPQENPDGYAKTSVVRAARDLHGRLLIIHGGMDDNVHVANAWQLIDALQRADKDFEVMIYPRARHGVGGRHAQRLEVEFMRRVLKPGS